MVYVCCLEAKFECVAIKQYARHALVDCDDDARQRTFICSHSDHSAPGLLAAFSFVVVFVVTVAAVWLSAKVIGHIHKVTLRRAGLVLRWVTICGYTILIFNQATHTNSARSSLRGQVE